MLSTDSHQAVMEEFHVAAGPNALRDARERLATAVMKRGLPLSGGAIADAKLCASEIITNALAHAGGECWVSAEWTGGRLVVKVRDRSLRLPAINPASEFATSGRGLALVATFAHSWGWEPRELGKVVNFAIAADQAVTGDERLATLVRTAAARLPDDEPGSAGAPRGLAA